MAIFNVILVNNYKYYDGKLEVRQHELIFTFGRENIIKIDFIDHFCVYRADKSNYSDKKDRFLLNIITKQLKCYEFCFLTKLESENCVKDIQKNFNNRMRVPCSYDINKTKFLEHNDFTDVNKPSIWRISCINQNYNLCESLPENNIVIDGISDQSLIESKKCHINGRFPIINYVNSTNKSCILTASNVNTNVVINQPTRCLADEAMIAHASHNIQDNDVYIVQITTLSNSALVQQLNNKEKSFSNQTVNGTNLLNSWMLWTNFNTLSMNVLPLTQLSLCLGHILVSLQILPPKYYPSNTLFGLTTENSTHLWLNSIYVCLSKACLFSQYITKTQSIIFLMEETGVDYTIIISSLCQILLESNCRTIEGFLSLIYRDWIVMGHPFESRHSTILPDNNSKLYNQYGSTFDGNAPVFFLFLNCVKIILQKYCRYFEFNENLLLHLFKYSYECKLGNNEKSRNENFLKIKYSSLWNIDYNLCINQLYMENNNPLIEKFWPHDMELWDTIFLQQNDHCNIKLSSYSQLFIEKTNQLYAETKM